LSPPPPTKMLLSVPVFGLQEMGSLLMFNCLRSPLILLCAGYTIF
jgi:hypothetical protein